MIDKNYILYHLKLIQLVYVIIVEIRGGDLGEVVKKVFFFAILKIYLLLDCSLKPVCLKFETLFNHNVSFRCNVRLNKYYYNYAINTLIMLEKKVINNRKPIFYFIKDLYI